MRKRISRSTNWQGCIPSLTGNSSLRAALSSRLEVNPDPFLFSPDDAARQMVVVGFDHQREAVGYADRGCHVERGTRFREIAHRAVDRAAAKRNPARLQQATPWCRSVLVHQHGLRMTGMVSILHNTTFRRWQDAIAA